MPTYPQLILGVALAIGVGGAAWVAGALSLGGAAGAALVGALTFGFGGLPAAVLLLGFFVSSSALSAWRRDRKRAIVAEFAKGSRRDLRQVIANGAAATASSVLLGLTGDPIWLAGVTAALAAAAADTWATEIGVLAAGAPRRISDWQPAPVGASGAVSLQGSLAALAGAALLAGLGVWVSGGAVLAVAGLAGGAVGALADSWLGAVVQARYLCPQCRRQTERHPRHHCGSRTEFAGGWRWLDNDGVNLVATSLGCLCGLALQAALS